MSVKRKGLWKRTGACLLTASIAAICTGCGANSSKGTIAVIVKSQSTYWEALRAGVNDAAGETGYTISYSAPETEAEINVQEQYVLDAIKNNAKAIVIAPINVNDLNDELAQADAAGIPVICVDSDCSFEKKRAFISSNNLNAGSIEGREAGKLLVSKGGGTVAIVGHKQDAGNAIGRIGGFIDALVLNYGASVEDLNEEQFLSGSGMSRTEAISKAREVRKANDFPEIRIIDLKYCDGQKDIAKENTEYFLTQYPDLSLLFATNGQTTIGTCEQVTEMKRSGKVAVMGFDSGEDQIKAMESLTLEGLIAQSPYNMGYLGVRYAHKCINNEKIPSLVDTGVTYVNFANLKDAEIQLLINPQDFENYKAT